MLERSAHIYARTAIHIYIHIYTYKSRFERGEGSQSLFAYSHKSIEPKVADFSLRQSRSTPVSIPICENACEIINENREPTERANGVVDRARL